MKALLLALFVATVCPAANCQYRDLTGNLPVKERQRIIREQEKKDAKARKQKAESLKEPPAVFPLGFDNARNFNPSPNAQKKGVDCFQKSSGIAGLFTRKKKICLEMTTSEVRALWGPPDNVSQTFGRGLDYQTWFYEASGGRYLRSETTILFFEHGSLKVVEYNNY